MYIIKIGCLYCLHTGANVVPLRTTHSIRFVHNYLDWIPSDQLDHYNNVYSWCENNIKSEWDIIVSFNRFDTGTIERLLELHVMETQEALMAKLKWEDTL